MPLIDYWKQGGQKVLPFLAADEHVLAYTATGISPAGEAAVPPEPRPETADRSGWDRVGSVVDHALSGSLIDPRHASKFFSVPAAGNRTSTGVRILEELRRWDISIQEHMLAVTPLRLLVLATTGSRLDSPLQLVADVPRAMIADAQVRTKMLRLSFGRLRIGFQDGSWIEFTGWPAMGRTRAKQTRDAIMTGRSSVHGPPGMPPSVG
ncbi:MAG: hypothetical protein H0V10_08840 [Geodermatophilaceae bacterium]|nr:hypothetical protein [Geodermatophilaceae bacterium]